MSQQDYELALFALTLWREARGESVEAKRCVAWSIWNRVKHPSWWGTTLAGVLTKRWQYSSMTAVGDTNLSKWPDANDTSWQACLQIVEEIEFCALPDPTGGATHYFDKSLDGGHEPQWATDKSMTHCYDVGSFHFYRVAT